MWFKAAFQDGETERERFNALICSHMDVSLKTRGGVAYGNAPQAFRFNADFAAECHGLSNAGHWSSTVYPIEYRVITRSGAEIYVKSIYVRPIWPVVADTSHLLSSCKQPSSS